MRGRCPGPEPEEREFIPRRNCDSSRSRPTISFSLAMALPSPFFLWAWAPRGCIFSRTGFNADQPVIYAPMSAIDFKFNRGYRPIMYPSRSNETRFEAWNELWEEGRGGKGRLWALDSAFFWPADDWNSPRVIRTCLRLRFMEIGGWFTSGWVSNGIWGSYRVMWIIGTGVISGIVENLTIFHSW